ncbi:MAG TPA: murein biosynthesis integral membrane protein MurJ [Vitreimonas sp.]|uniref:murein biosynthesis integral membrane protein MurJ n=1 Tax=Vitreimonas sp. TaxID=3069702 RepID=UPI002D4907BA|nr:murein biosynthesis integral membrane protein MurJ [Vitreimonas sp.]HYD89631.1 murein biosynthesis integral membrane protein MurJ [Vitreimonas sp.]
MSLARNTLVQSAFTLGSRVFGFLRDAVIAARIGAGPVGDAWQTALQFPNLFRRLFAEGAFAQAFVPIYARIEAERGPEAAQQAASEAMNGLLAATAAFSILAQIAMPWIMLVVHAGYRDDPLHFNLTVAMTQLTMPYLVGMAMSSLFSGVLNSAGRFALSAFAPTLLNLVVLAAVLPFEDPYQAAYAASIGVTIAGVLQAVLLAFGMLRLGVKLRFALPRWTPDLQRIVAVAVPGAVAGSAMQINIVVSQVLASLEVGAKSWLAFADRLYQLPLGLIGVAIGIAILPRLARATRIGDSADEARTMDDAITLSMAFTLPAAAALGVAPFFLLDGFWTRGEFTSADARMSALALQHFAWGVPAFVLVKVFTPPFFAREDSRRPMQFALVTVALNVVFGVALFFGLREFGVPGFMGLAIATSLASWVNVLLLSLTLARRGMYRLGGAAASRLVRIALATTLMAGAIGAAAYYRPVVVEALGSKEVAVLAVCLAGFLLYAVLALAFGAVRLSEIRGALRRERVAPDGGDGLPPGLDG